MTDDCRSGYKVSGCSSGYKVSGARVGAAARELYAQKIMRSVDIRMGI